MWLKGLVRSTLVNANWLITLRAGYTLGTQSMLREQHLVLFASQWCKIQLFQYWNACSGEAWVCVLRFRMQHVCIYYWDNKCVYKPLQGWIQTLLLIDVQVSLQLAVFKYCKKTNYMVFPVFFSLEDSWRKKQQKVVILLACREEKQIFYTDLGLWSMFSWHVILYCQALEPI